MKTVILKNFPKNGKKRREKMLNIISLLEIKQKQFISFLIIYQENDIHQYKLFNIALIYYSLKNVTL